MMNFRSAAALSALAAAGLLAAGLAAAQPGSGRESRRHRPVPNVVTPATPLPRLAPRFYRGNPLPAAPSPGGPYFPWRSREPAWTNPPAAAPQSGEAAPPPEDNAAPQGYVYDDRPRQPPEFVDLSDVFTDVVSRFVADQAGKNQGYFVVKDDRDGSYLYLKLVRVYRDRITGLTPVDMFGCVEFDGANGTPGHYDLDFYLSNEDWSWKVSKLLIHKVNGKARFHYTSGHVPVAIEALAAAAPAPGAAAPPKPSAPARLQAQALFRSDSGAGVLRCDDPARLAVTVSNAGPGPAYAVRVVPSLQGDAPGLGLPEAVALGDIPAGSSAEASVPLTASWQLRSQQARLKLSVQEGNGFDADPVVVQFQTRAFKPPRLDVSGLRLGRGAIRAGEATPLSVSVTNSGSGAAQAVTASLQLGSPDIFMSGEPQAELGTLKPGETKTAEFEFFVKKRYPGAGPLPVSVALAEATGRYGLAARALPLSLGRGAPAAALVRVPSADEIEDVDAPPASRTKTDPEAYAVVVGVEKYRDIPAVEFAARDAQAVYDYLTGAMGFDRKNVVQLVNERATRTDLATYLGPWLKDRVTAKSRVFVYFSGHGSPDPVTGEGYLIPYDGSPNYVGSSAVSLKQLYDGLSQLPAQDVTVVLDSCFSGAGGRSFLAPGIRPLVNVRLAAPGPNIVVLSAAAGDQISTYYPEAQHGVFTYFLLKGLRGAADPDHRGLVTTGRLFEYLRPEVERQARRQHVEQSPAIAPELSVLGARASRVWLKLK
jgi:hypothetical protein